LCNPGRAKTTVDVWKLGCSFDKHLAEAKVVPDVETRTVICSLSQSDECFALKVDFPRDFFPPLWKLGNSGDNNLVETKGVEDG
jgi:hypothetical protein